MKLIQGIEINDASKEEMLPGFSSDFPYIATRAELDRYLSLSMGTPWHWHRTAELFYVESGLLEYTTPHGKWVFPAGSGGLVNTNVLHCSNIKSKEHPNVQLLHLFDPAFLAGGPGSRMEAKYIFPLTSSGLEIIPLHPHDPAQQDILNRILEAFQISDQLWGYEFQLRDALVDIWLKLFELARPAIESLSRSGRTDALIKSLMVYIYEHYQEPISVEQLAEAAHISKRVCFRIFQENLHMTPVEYIRAYRLQKACYMLENSGASLTQIAYSCGLGSSSYFGKQFREYVGCTPAQYRKRWQDCDRK